jgi:hypothetical protein
VLVALYNGMGKFERKPIFVKDYLDVPESEIMPMIPSP